MDNTLFETFKARAEAVAAEVHRFPTRRTALDFVLELFRSQAVQDSPQGALWAGGSFLEGFGKEAFAGTPGLSFDVTRQAAAGAKVGISQMDWAIADTGTLVQDAARVDLRLVSTLPAIHVALIGTSRILADLPSVFGRLHPDQTGCISLITGPSRTADIERVLTIGVHGPERLIIVCVDELQREAA
jgi:L-lactate dehydrogenase complex protein LldG